jgi:hypothetical protein
VNRSLVPRQRRVARLRPTLLIGVLAVGVLASAVDPLQARVVQTNAPLTVVPQPGTARGPRAIPTPQAPPPPAPGGTNVPLRDIREVVEIPNPWRWVGRAAAGVALLALAAVGYWLWRRQASRAQAAAPPENPADIARRQLLAAEASMANPRDFGVAVSDAIRRYLENRFGLRAPEQTTEEFLAGLQQRPVLDQRHQELLVEFLEQCDFLKFAGAQPDPDVEAGLLAAGRRLVEETDPARAGGWPPAPPTAPATGGAA